jgi:hypothetical protein
MTDAKVMLRTSERTSFKTCRQQWYWSYVERRTPKTPAKALRFGDLIHRSLAPYYKPGQKRGPHPSQTLHSLLQESQEQGFVLRNEDGDWEDALDLGVAMLDHYVERWGGDPEWEILWSECPAEIDLTYARSRRYLITYVCTFDSVFRDHSKNGQLGLLETKTTAAISTTHLPLDEQAGSYWAMAPLWLRQLGVLKPGRDIDFILYNFLRKSKPDTRARNSQGLYLNQDGRVSKKQPSPYFLRQPIYRSEIDRENLLTRIRMEAYEMDLVRKGKLPVYKNPRGTFPDQHCLSCPFRDPCELHETGNEWREMMEVTTTEWNPYEDHDDPIFPMGDE